jgi:hypothetical protein
VIGVRVQVPPFPINLHSILYVFFIISNYEQSRF